VQVFRLKNTKTGVLVVHTFDITSLDTRDVDTFFVQEIYLAFDTLKRLAPLLSPPVHQSLPDPLPCTKGSQQHRRQQLYSVAAPCP